MEAINSKSWSSAGIYMIYMAEKDFCIGETENRKKRYSSLLVSIFTAV